MLFGKITAVAVLALALAGPSAIPAHAGDGSDVTIRIRDRIETITVDTGAVLKLQLGPPGETAKLTPADQKALADAVPANGALGALLVTVDVVGDATAVATDQAFRRAKAVRTALSLTLGRLPEERIVIAALVGAKDAAQGTLRLFPILKPAPGDQVKGANRLRALSLDTAFLGPSVARLTDAGAPAAAHTAAPATATVAIPPAAASAPAPAAAPTPAATPALTPKATGLVRPSNRPEGKPAQVDRLPHAGGGAPGTARPLKSVQPSARQAIRPLRPAGKSSESASPMARQTEPALIRPPTSAVEAPRAEMPGEGGPVDCAPPKRIVNDFYPGGPFVPCPR